MAPKTVLGHGLGIILIVISGVYYAVTPDYNTYYYSLVFDITTGKPVFTDIQYIDRKNNRDILNSTVYNTFYQLKKKR